MLFNKFLGIEELHENVKTVVKRFVIVQIVTTFLGFMSSTFNILYSIDQIGFANTSLSISFMLFIQLIFDYPSGSLGDWIGQRWVLILSNVSYGIAFTLLPFTNTLTGFLIISFFNGFGNAQNSGTLQTWLDNNYKKTVGMQDQERKVYGFFRSRILTLTRLTSAFSFLIGGHLASTISRRFVFHIQAVFTLLVLFVIYLLVQDLDLENEEELRAIPYNNFRNGSYIDYLVGGIKFVLKDKIAFFFIVGSALYFSAITIWAQLLLFPIYFGYTGSDSSASLLRSIIFFTGIPISLLVSRVNKKIATSRLPLVNSLFVLLFFSAFTLLTINVPVRNVLNILGCVLTYLIMNSLIPTLSDLESALRQRTMIDLVPTENRNAVYSLIPTVISIFSIPILPIAGYFIETFGIPVGTISAFCIGIIGSTLIFVSFSLRHILLTQRAKDVVSSELIIPVP